MQALRDIAVRYRLRDRARSLARRWDHLREPRIAWLSPMPPAPSGIATYSAAVLDALARIGYPPRPYRLQPIWPIRPRDDSAVPWFALCVYHIGNNVVFHREIYAHAIRTPGLVVVHDLALDDLVKGLVALGDPLGYAARREALALADRLGGGEAMGNEPLRTPYVAQLARHARGIVVHSPFAARYLRAIGCRTPVFVVPHPPVERDATVAAAARRRGEVRSALEARGARRVVGVLGDLNAAKLIDVVAEAVGRLPDDVHLALVGRRIAAYDAQAVVSASGIGSRATVLADVSDDDFLAWLCAVDVVVDLRHPHRGEVSGSLARAMQARVPAIVSSTGTYLDVPDDLVVRVSAGRVEPGELAAAIRRLLEDDERRRAVADAAHRHMAELAASDATAHGYADAMASTLALVRDPTRKALERWALALSDVGVTQKHLADGYGRSYADALEELRPSERGAPAG